MNRHQPRISSASAVRVCQEKYGRLLRKEPNPIEKAIDFGRNLPIYVKFQDPSGRPGVEVGFKFAF